MTPEEQVQVYRSCTGFIMAFDMTDEMTLRMIPGSLSLSALLIYRGHKERQEIAQW
jgi:hypothetical protein